MQSQMSYFKKSCLHFVCLLAVISLTPVNISFSQDAKQGSRQLVEALSHSDPNVRANAEQALLIIGEGAIKELEIGRKSVDIDFSRRCSTMLKKLLKNLEQERSREFLQASEEEEKRFPTWLKFKSFVEDDSEEARRFFQAICESSSENFEGLHLQGVEQDDPVSAVALSKKAAKLLKSGGSHTGFLVMDLIARERLELHRDSPEVTRFREQWVLNTIATLGKFHAIPPLNDATGKEHQQLFTKLLVRWHGTLADDSEMIRAGKQRLILASQNKALVGMLASQYSNLSSQRKIELLDILDSSARSKEKIDSVSIASWLEPILKDNEVLITTRFQDKPREIQKVSGRRLALAVAYRNLFARGDVPSFDQKPVFGKFPLTATKILLLTDRKAEDAVSKKISELADSATNATPK